jgi:hypothetical protein
MKKNEQLEIIAKEELNVATLDIRNSDEFDFYDVSIWSIKKALERAYQLGVNSKRNQIDEEME